MHPLMLGVLVGCTCQQENGAHGEGVAHGVWLVAVHPEGPHALHFKGHSAVLRRCAGGCKATVAACLWS